MESMFKQKFPKLYDDKAKRIRLSSSKNVVYLYKGKPLNYSENGFIVTYCKEQKD